MSAKENTKPVCLEQLFQAGSQQLYWDCATWFAMFTINFVEKFEKCTKIIIKTLFWRSYDFVVWGSLKKH